MLTLNKNQKQPSRFCASVAISPEGLTRAEVALYRGCLALRTASPKGSPLACTVLLELHTLAGLSRHRPSETSISCL